LYLQELFTDMYISQLSCLSVLVTQEFFKPISIK
jgi:hypothetical protein